MEQTRQRQGRDAWERMSWLWTLLFYGPLIYSTVVALLEDETTANQRALIIILTAFLTGWHILLLRLDQDRIWSNPRLGLPLMFVAIIAWYPLVHIHDVFYFVLTGLFPAIYSYLKIRLAIVVSLLPAIIAVIGQTQGEVTLDSPIVWFYGIGIAMAALLGIWINGIIGQSVRRRMLIEQLEATRAQLAAAERREGVLEERDRLAREIHDTLSQGFTSIVMHLEAAEQAFPEDMETLQRHLVRARETARDSLRQAREVVQDLRPDLLAQQSLPQAIERVAARWGEETGVQIRATTTGTPVPLPPEVDITLLRTVQEALANVRKHARASAVTVTLSYMGDVVMLDVQDDGVGLKGAAPSPLSSGFGLTAMRERIEQLGGALMVESEADEGTTLVIEIPVGGPVSKSED